MAFFKPHFIFDDVTKITPEFLADIGVGMLLLDVDNTLTMHGSQKIEPEIWLWLRIMKINKIRPVLFSNNSDKRIRPFAHSLGLEYIANAAKPLPVKLRRAMAKISADPRYTAIIGDQLFTDILCANLAHLRGILVMPIEPEVTVFFKIKRFFERHILRYHEKRNERRAG